MGPRRRPVRAATTAASTSPADARGTRPTTSPLAGDRTTRTSESTEATQSPPMNNRS